MRYNEPTERGPGQVAERISNPEVRPLLEEAPRFKRISLREILKDLPGVTRDDCIEHEPLPFGLPLCSDVTFYEDPEHKMDY